MNSGYLSPLLINDTTYRPFRPLPTLSAISIEYGVMNEGDLLVTEQESNRSVA
jgi:hypothetical protein